MKFYAVRYLDEKGKMRRMWARSQGEAGKLRKSIRAIRSLELFDTQIIDVPTDKNSLMHWMNTNATSL